MKIALVSEGTYPYAMGGVSVWCDQLVRGLADYSWDIVALTVGDGEREAWPRPDNLGKVVSVPLWADNRSARLRRPGPGFHASYQTFLRCLVTPMDTRPEQAAAFRAEFLHALRGLYEYAAGGGDLGGAILSNDGLGMVMEVWHSIRSDEGTGGAGLSLADAVQAAWLIEHMLRPLSAPPVEADVVHCSMNGLSMLVGMTAKWRYGTPVLLSEHGIYLRERYIAYLDEDAPHAVKVLVLSFFRCLAGAGYLIADALAPHSSYNRRWQLRNGGSATRMWTMYNGVAPESFPSAEAEPDRPTIVFMGRIDPLKDLHTLIRAFAIVNEKLPESRLRIFGGTPAVNAGYRDSCAELIVELGLAEAAFLEGRVDNPVEAYHSGSVVALTSISEGFPYTVVEAMACGRTVVCTDVGGVSEAVGDAGIVVPPRDVAAIAEGCLRLLEDDDLRHDLAAKARSRVLDRFTLAQSIQAYRDLYEHITDPQLTAAAEQPALPAAPTAVVPRATGRARVEAPATGRVRVEAPATGRARVEAPAIAESVR